MTRRENAEHRASMDDAAQDTLRKSGRPDAVDSTGRGGADGAISRRDALAVIGVAPLAAMLETSPAQVVRALDAARFAREHGTAFVPQFFTAHEYRTVEVLVDIIIPRDDRSGSATDAGVPEFMDFIMIDRPGMQAQMRGGLRWLDNESVDRYGRRFVDVADSERIAIVEDLAWPARARPDLSHGVAFFNYFRDLTAGGFWSSRMGVEDVGYLGNAPMDWDGCPPDALARLGVNYDMMNRKASR